MRRMHILLAGLVIAAVLLAGLILTSPSQAQNAPVWLPFDGISEPGEPSLALLSASSTKLEFQTDLPGAYADPVTAEGSAYTRLTGAGYGHPAAYGLPDLPILRKEVEVPFGAEVHLELISAKYADHNLQELGLNPVYPLQYPVPKEQAAEDSQPFTLDIKFYTAGSLYPSGVVSVGQPYIVRGHRLVQVEVWPVGYEPSQGSLRLYSQVTFRLSLSGSDVHTTRRLAQRYSSPAFDDALAGRVLNYNQGQPSGAQTSVGLLIITTDAYHDAMLPLVALRESRGFDVTLTNQSEIPNGSTTEGIKAYIQEAYDTWPLPPSYVLLVGDTNTLPTWIGPVIGTSSDLYYGTMDGPDDWHPDLGRGRFPVRSAAQATAMVDKYLEYSALTGQEPWLKTASFPATCDLYQIAEGTHNYVIDNYTSPGGWTGNFPTPLNPGGDQLYCITYGATTQDLLNMFNEGRWAIIYSGHGNYDGWEFFSSANVDSLAAYGMYPFVASHACLSGDFGQPEVYGETWVLQEGKGALVYWGSSTYSYWDEDDVLERVMFDSLFDEGVSPPNDVATMTDAGLAGVEAAYPSSARYYRETYNVLGDPSVHLFIEPEMPTFTLNLDPSSLEVCTAGTLTSDVLIGSVMGYSSTVYLDSSEPPFDMTATFDPAQAPAPYTSTLTLVVTDRVPQGDYTLTITATDQVSLTQAAPLSLRVNAGLPLAPTLLSPADGALDEPLTPSFDWDDQDLVSGYNFELATGPLFETLVVTATGLSDSGYSVGNPLEGGKCYWWHTQAGNACGTSDWATPFHFSSVALGTSFYDDIESGAALWTHAAVQGVDHWVISSAQYHSPTQAWFVPDDDTVTDTRMWTTTPILVGVGSTLSFWHRYEFEGTSYDGSVLEISTDLGESWADLGPFITANGYNGVVDAGFSNPLANRPAWTGDLTEWTEVSVDLGSFDGLDVMIRWRLGCDSSVSDVGWYIDDVQVTAPLLPNPPPALLSISPKSGFNDLPTPLVITGTNFLDTPALQLGDTWLISVSLVSSTTITAVVPAGIPAGAYDLALINGDCQETVLESAFEVLAPPVFHYIYLPLTVR